MGDRAVSPMLSYVLALGIVALLISSLFLGMSGYVEKQRAAAIQSELDVVGNRLATDLGVAERLALRADAGTVALTSTVPDRVAGTSYTVQIEQDGPAGTYRLTLRTEDPQIAVLVRLRSRVPIETGTVRGGDVSITFDAATDELGVEHA